MPALRVLVLSDHPHVREELAARLEEVGAMPVTVSVRLALLSVLGAARPPEVAIVDLDHASSAQRAVATLRAARAVAPVAILACSILPPPPLLVREFGLLHLPKPITAAALDGALHRARRMGAVTRRLSAVVA